MAKEQKSAFGTLRRRLDAFAHPWQRRNVSARIRARVRPGQVLFLCQGNICRSPFAEALFRREIARASVPGAFDTTSAGFIGPNRRPPAEALASAARLGIDIARHRSKVVTADLVRGSSLVVVMSPEQATTIRSRFPAEPTVVVLGDLDPDPIDSRTIRDPWNSAADVFDESYARIDRCVRSLVGLVSLS